MSSMKAFPDLLGSKLGKLPPSSWPNAVSHLPNKNKNNKHWGAYEKPDTSLSP